MLRIRDWDEHFERGAKKSLRAGEMWFIKLPNKLDNAGYVALVTRDPQGAAHYGCWIAIMAIASRCRPRGVLVMKGGKPHTAETMAEIARLPVPVMRAAIAKLLTVGWLESDGPVEKIREEKEEEKSFPTVSDRFHVDAETASRFREFSEMYPKQVRMGHALKVFAASVRDAERHQSVMDGLGRWMASEQWQSSIKRDGGKFVPAAERWLADERWREYPAPPKADPFDEAARRLKDKGK